VKFRALLTTTALAASAVAGVAATERPADLAEALGAGLTADQAQADLPVGAGYWQEIDFPSLDGTMLHADVILPGRPDQAPEGGWPMIFSIGPYFGEGQGATENDPVATGPEPRFYDFIEGADILNQGYGWAQVDSRGYGSSAGCSDYGGIGEQMDVFAAAEYFGEAPYSNGHVGMWGKSYDAWTQVMGLAMNPPHLDAVVIQSPIIDGYRIAFDHGVHWDSGWYVTPGLYTAYDANPPAPQHTSQAEWVQWLDSEAKLATCWSEGIAYSDLGYDESLPYWVERELVSRAKDTEIPVFWSMGFNDINTKPTNMLDLVDELQGYHRGWYGQWDHVRGNEVDKVGRDGFLEETLDFFDVFLKGEAEFDNELNANQSARIQTQFGDWYIADAYPPSHMQHFSMELLPGAYVDDKDAGDALWTVTEPAPYDVHLSGEPVFNVDVDIPLANANMIVKVWDTTDSGQATLIARGAQLITESGQFTFDAWPQDYLLEADHIIAIEIGTSDAEYNDIPTGQTVTLKSGTVDLPFLTEQIEYELYGYPASVANATGKLDASVFANLTPAFTWPPTVR